MDSTAILIVHASTPAQLADARRMFAGYALSLGWDLTGDRRLAHEMDALPGPYAPPRGSLLLAYVDGVPVGVLGLQAVPEGARIAGVGAESAGELKRLFVQPESRRHGLGLALMLRAEAEAIARGYDSLVLTTSPEMMPLAQHLYESLGYTESAPYRDDMPWPGIRWMRKGLAGAK